MKQTDGRRHYRHIEREILPPRRHHRRRMQPLSGREWRGWKYGSCLVFLVAWIFSIWELIFFPMAGWQRYGHIALTTVLVATHFTGPFWFGPRMSHAARVAVVMGSLALAIGAAAYIGWLQAEAPSPMSFFEARTASGRMI